MTKLLEIKLFRYLALPLIVLVVYLGLVFLLRKIGFPAPEQIIAFTQTYYERYGYWVVLAGALGEGTLLINWYLPGSIVVALGIVFARAAGLNIFLMFSLVVLGFFLTAILNYVLGRYGWYHVFLKLGLKGPLDNVQAKVEDKGLKILFTTYVHPNFGALAATAAGILRLSFSKFLLFSLISITVWNSLWTVLFYYFGSFLLRYTSFLIVIGGIFVYFMIMRSLKDKKIIIP